MAARKRPLPARFKIQISSLEADVAFCNALITFAGQIPGTVYQRAEIRVYRTLEQELQQRLEAARREARERVEKLSA
ncbi:MAG TPA: hypothetical protein ENJ98_01495 [Thiolapillus brandeum]|uniref:Uncharacterized protein n=1 Tax=Thiolapillus brandeum TaxID=1076588 RepID=A0A7C5N982_9GAMM|nr:hypothetical protein [Thiolapillus brandeum]